MITNSSTKFRTCSIAEWQVASQTCCILSYSWCHHNWMAGVMQSHSHHGNEYCLLHAACCHFTLHACMIIIMQLPQEQYKPHRVCWHPLCCTLSCLFSMSSSENNEKWASFFFIVSVLFECHYFFLKSYHTFHGDGLQARTQPQAEGGYFS
jgi:hypothetical protein